MIELRKKFLDQRQEFGVGPGVRLAAMGTEMVLPAKCLKVLEVERFSAMVQRLDVVDFQAAGPAAGPTPPPIAVEGRFPGPRPGPPWHLGPGGGLFTRQRHVGACGLFG